MNGYLVPANTKKALLIMGMFRPVDVIIFGVGIGVSVIGLLIFSDISTVITLICCIPMLISLILVMPIPNYHNTLVALQSIMRFYNERRRYIWKGWCIYNEYNKK